MARPLRYRPDYRGIGDMLSHPYMQVEMHRRGQAVAVRAAQLAPSRTGEYVSQITVEFGVRSASAGVTRRAYARVVNNARYALVLEFGSRRRRVRFHRVLGRALDAAKEG